MKDIHACNVKIVSNEPTLLKIIKYYMYTAISKKVVIDNSPILEPKETLGMVMCQQRLLLYGRGIMMNMHSIFCKVNAN